jgi:hypothetical protein
VAVGLAQPRPGPPPAPVPTTCPGSQHLDATLFLIGDGGAPADAEQPPGAIGPGPLREPVLQALAVAGAERVARLGAARVALALLGDDVYPSGIPAADDPTRPRAERRLGAQLEVARRAGLRLFVLPGNHDWDEDASDGTERVLRLGRLVAASGIPDAEEVPPAGCPGPARAELGAHLELLFLDTEWWLRSAPKPGPSTCTPGDPDAVVASLAADLADSAGRHVVVMAHHPLETGGPHGVNFDWLDHLFPLRAIDPALWIPLPILGSAYPLARDLGVSEQDLPNHRYRRLQAALTRAFADAPPLVYAAGHDHGLQVIRGGPAPWLVVSGGGATREITFVRRIAGMLYGRARSGYVRLDAFDDGGVALAVVETVAHEPPHLAFEACLTAAGPTAIDGRVDRSTDRHERR